MAPPRTKLRSGDIVEIVTAPSHHPSRDWLGFVTSTRARQRIKHWLNLHQRQRAIEIGRKLLEREARRFRLSLKSIDGKDFQRVASEYGCAKPDHLIAGLAYAQ